MRLIADNIWTVPQPLSFFALKVNTRMTVCRLSGGGLVVISPIKGQHEFADQIDALGPVRAIIAPSLYHHLFLGEWMEAYPDAMSFGPPGLADKRPDLNIAHVLGPEFDTRFGEEILRIPIEGMPRINESLFFHRASQTLIATDLCFHLPEATGLTGLFASVSGIKHQPRCEPLFLLMVKDKEAFRASLRPLRQLAVAQLSMCHHSVIAEDAADALQGVLDQLKVEP